MELKPPRLAAVNNLGSHEKGQGRGQGYGYYEGCLYGDHKGRVTAKIRDVVTVKKREGLGL